MANGQYGAVWSMGHTQQVYVRIVLLPSNVWQQFLRQQETDLPPAEMWFTCSFFDRTIYLSSAGVVLFPRAVLHIPVVLNDFHSRETTLDSIYVSLSDQLRGYGSRMVMPGVLSFKLRVMVALMITMREDRRTVNLWMLKECGNSSSIVSSLLDCGSKLRGPMTIVLEDFPLLTLLNKQSIKQHIMQLWALLYLMLILSIGLQTGRPGFDGRCHQIPSEYTQSTRSLNQWTRKSCGRSQQKRREQGLKNISLPSSSMPILRRWRSGVSPSIGTCLTSSGNIHSFPSIISPSEIELSPVWCSKLRPTTGVHLAACHDVLRRPLSDYVRQDQRKEKEALSQARTFGEDMHTRD
ncbi:hypothetical protein TNCV_4972221 [Trichonephila clavipes]|nr:hypothetical protein TNCV_4972221 [Trichonephila clavipes]